MRIEQMKIRQLLDRCEDGIFAIPEIQREFVWDGRRSAKLLDSIYNRLPIGNILVWKAAKRFQYFLRKSVGALPPHNPKNCDIWYLIDGQQRLIVLYQTRRGGEITNYYDREIYFNHICFALKRGESAFELMRNPAHGEYIRVSDILSPQWRRRIKGLSGYKRRRVEHCRNRLLEYRVPVLFMQTDKPEDVRESFLRINSGGMRVSAADIAFTWASRLGLRRLVNELRDGLPFGYQYVDRSTIQSSAAWMMGLRDVRGAAIQSFLQKKEDEYFAAGTISEIFTELWRNIHNAITKTVDYLTSALEIPNYEFLPSENILAVLSIFFYMNDSAQPSARQARELNKWFWATAVRGRYSGRGYSSNIISDIRFIARLAKVPSTRFGFNDRLPMGDLLRAEYRASASLTKAFFLLLCTQHPLYLENAKPIPLGETASMKNRNDKHHIFPKALLRRANIVEREADRLCNICFMVAEDNQSFGSKRPRQYLEEFKSKRTFSLVMRSHLIPHYKGGGLWEKNVRRGYRTFLAQRMHFVIHAFEKQAGGMRLFRKD